MITFILVAMAILAGLSLLAMAEATTGTPVTSTPVSDTPLYTPTPVGPLTLSGLDTRGRAWTVRNVGIDGLDQVVARVYLDGRPYVEACGRETLADLTSRHGIRWER